MSSRIEITDQFKEAISKVFDDLNNQMDTLEEEILKKGKKDE